MKKQLYLLVLALFVAVPLFAKSTVQRDAVFKSTEEMRFPIPLLLLCRINNHAYWIYKDGSGIHLVVKRDTSRLSRFYRGSYL